jgi:hypothetical protein
LPPICCHGLTALVCEGSYGKLFGGVDDCGYFRVCLGQLY